jgi:hypothetical protein
MDLLKLRRTVFELLIEGHVQVIVLVGYNGVTLPDQVVKVAIEASKLNAPTAPPVVTLDYGYGLARPAPDLKMDWFCVAATLIFNGVEHLTVIPWGAIVAMRTPDDAFVAGFAVEEAPPVMPAGWKPPEPPKRGGLKAV